MSTHNIYFSEELRKICGYPVSSGPMGIPFEFDFFSTDAMTMR